MLASNHEAVGRDNIPADSADSGLLHEPMSDINLLGPLGEAPNALPDLQDWEPDDTQREPAYS